MQIQLANYATDLISYYLDSVLAKLQVSVSARKELMSSYKMYRGLQTPKPSYSQFASLQDVDADWWQNRLRLLQLLGGTQGATSHYDVPSMLERVKPFERELVPEMIVLVGKLGQHDEAIRLLVHGLSDFDTAIRYCLLGGSATYSPLSDPLSKDTTASRYQQQVLFNHLLEEFLAVEDIEVRLDQTSELLERFAGWFDPIHVSNFLPWTKRHSEAQIGHPEDTEFMVY